MVGKNIGLMFRQFKLNLQKEYQYKSSFYTQIIMMMLNNAFFILQWLIIFGITDSIGGYGFSEIMLLWGLTASTFGLAHMFFGGVFEIGTMVYNGKLDVFLTQPKNVLINLASSRSSISAIGDLLYGFVALAIAGATWWWYLALIPVAFVGALIYVGVIVCYQSLSFYVKNGSALADIMDSAMFHFSTYPPVIFNTAIKILLFTIIPCGFIFFVPLDSIFLGFNIWWILGMLAFAIFVVTMAFVLFNKGLKRYNSGNLMGGRL